jgi:glycosyltransferase involved in cell wall biosynthesis
MKKCKAFICPSIWYEVTPFTNLEAFSTGTPVIASRLGSMIDTIKEGYNGLHFTAGDANDLRQKVEMFIQQTEKSSDYYRNARRSYLDTYHPDVHYRAIMKIYENAISAGNV